MADTAIVMAVASQMVQGTRMIGIAFVDAATRRLGAAEFSDDEQLCELDRVLVQLGAKEVVLPQVHSLQPAHVCIPSCFVSLPATNCSKLSR
jgi:DNA mismatch repair ATPase MutS